LFCVFHRRSCRQSFAIADRKECIAEEALRYTPVAETNAMHILPATTAKKRSAVCYKRKPATKGKVTPMTEERLPTPALNDIVTLLLICFNRKRTIFITTMQKM
jgi:hypothetical protein